MEHHAHGAGGGRSLLGKLPGFSHKLPAPAAGNRFRGSSGNALRLVIERSRVASLHSSALYWICMEAFRCLHRFYRLPSDLAFVASVNLLVTSRVVEHFRGRHTAMKKADADRELGAYGIANLAAGMFAAPMSVGIPARSLANVQCGGTTRLSNLFHAAFLILFVTEGSAIITHLPVAALAGVTAWMGIRLMEWSMWKRLAKMRRVDAAAFLSTSIAALFLNAVFAVALGVSFYAVAYLYRNRTYFSNRKLFVAENTVGLNN